MQSIVGIESRLAFFQSTIARVLAILKMDGVWREGVGGLSTICSSMFFAMPSMSIVQSQYLTPARLDLAARSVHNLPPSQLSYQVNWPKTPAET